MVVLERMRGRFVAFRQRPAGERLEVGDAGVPPPLRLLLLDRQERRDLRMAPGVDVISEIRRDPSINEDQKKSLVRIYESFRKENDAESAAS